MGQNSGLLSSLTDWNSTLAGYADSISTGVVMPVALTLLALFMILELYNATQRIAMNGSNNAFTIQQIALVMLKIVVCQWAVVHTTEILNALFEIASTVTTGISGYVGSGEVNTTVDIENAIAALPGGIGNMPVALELMVVGWMLRIVNIVVNTIVAARFIELYGVTWNYANGIYNDTAEIISLAAVYYQQDWPRSELVSAFGDNVPFTKFCRALAAYGLDVTARESAPYSCMSYGGCVNGYRSEGEVVSIKDYRLETHTCSEGDDACGQYDAAAEWHWNEGHAENESYTVWKENGTHDVTVFFPVIFPDGATGSELSDLPEEYNAVADGKIKAADCTGNIVLDDSANLYKGELNDWFYTPDELTVTFTVVTGEGDDAVSDDYEVTFSNATAIPWCPGELNDGQYGHYDLDCTIYLTGYDRYTDPETQAPNGADGGTGNLEALAESCDAGTLTRTIIKQDQYGNEYAGNAVSARYTKTITLPNGANGFQGWYKDGEDAYGNVEWASLLYRMDWEELYGIVDGIKCRATGSGMTEEELRQLFASLNIDATTARGQVVAFALSCQGKFVYAQPSSLRGGPGNPSVGINLDCSSFVQYCYWAQNLLFSAGSTAAYRNAADLVSISPSEVQPGDLRVVYASGGEQGHVQMALGGGAWIECCYGYGVAVNMSNTWMESRPCYYFRYAGF